LSKQLPRNEQLSDRYLEIPDAMLKFRFWPVCGLQI
jgi:hypothetical protein